MSVTADHGGIAIGALYQQRAEAPGEPVHLNLRPEFLFGREELLAELDARLAGGAGPRLVALCGLGGAGKTSLAVEYAHRHLDEVGVCWQFPAENPESLEADFGKLAAELGARDLVDARDPVASVHRVLARAQTEWMLIFDNVVDREAAEPFIPPAGNGRVLVTTQNQHWPRGQALDVPVLDTEVAARFLVSRTGDPDLDAARELAAGLGGLPLGLEQAAAFMRAATISMPEYLGLFADQQADMLVRGEADGHRRHVAATLGLALSRMAEATPTAVGLARLLAFLAPEPVPLNLLLASAGTLGPETAVIEPLLGNRLAVGDAVLGLRRYSLITPARGGLVLVHRLVQAVTRDQLPTGTAAEWKKAAAALVETAVPADPEAPGSWPACAALLPHARAVLDLASDGMARIARYLGSIGSQRAAGDLFRLVVDAYQASDAYGPEHPDTLTARHNLAFVSATVEDPAAARDQFAALLPVRERVLGAEHRDTLTTRYELARWTGWSGDAASARDQLITLLPVRERVLGAEHRDTLTTRGELARWMGSSGDKAGARDQLAAVLAARERVLGREHPDTLVARHNLADWRGDAGDAAGARDQLAGLLPDRERALGPEHPGTLATRRQLTHWTGVAGDAAGARDQLAALLPAYERVEGPEHRDTLFIRLVLAHWTGVAGDAAGARDQFAVLLPVYIRVLGPDHPHTRATRRELANWTKRADETGDTTS